MGMCAGILAIGPYSPDIVHTLEYPAEFYSKTRPGVPVITTLFGMIEGSSVSREFAAYLGITDAWDFDQHKIDPANVDFDGLRQFLSRSDDAANHLQDSESFVLMRAKRFDFYFPPNG